MKKLLLIAAIACSLTLSACVGSDKPSAASTAVGTTAAPGSTPQTAASPGATDAAASDYTAYVAAFAAQLEAVPAQFRWSDAVLESIFRWALNDYSGELTAEKLSFVRELVVWRAPDGERFTSEFGGRYFAWIFTRDGECLTADELHARAAGSDVLSSDGAAWSGAYWTACGEPVRDLSDLARLPNLEYVSISYSAAADYSVLKTLPKLIKAEINGYSQYTK